MIFLSFHTVFEDPSHGNTPHVSSESPESSWDAPQNHVTHCRATLHHTSRNRIHLCRCTDKGPVSTVPFMTFTCHVQSMKLVGTQQKSLPQKQTFIIIYIDHAFFIVAVFERLAVPVKGGRELLELGCTAPSSHIFHSAPCDRSRLLFPTLPFLLCMLQQLTLQIRLEITVGVPDCDEFLEVNVSEVGTGLSDCDHAKEDLEMEMICNERAQTVRAKCTLGVDVNCNGRGAVFQIVTGPELQACHVPEVVHVLMAAHHSYGLVRGSNCPQHHHRLLVHVGRTRAGNVGGFGYRGTQHMHESGHTVQCVSSEPIDVSERANTAWKGCCWCQRQSVQRAPPPIW
jgi:hypothetical protein